LFWPLSRFIATYKTEGVINIMSNANARHITLSATERAGLMWVKSSHSGANGQCVEIASAAGHIAIRDSKNPDGPILVAAPSQFRAFLNAARNGEFS
jgi:hypothetical protein